MIKKYQMAKTRERSIARNYYVDLGKTAKEISLLIAVSEQTLTKWINDPKDNWKEQRLAKISNAEVRTDNLKQVINGLCEDRLTLDYQLKNAMRDKDSKAEAELRTSIARVDDALSKWNKALQALDKENKVPLNVTVKVMEEIFNELRVFNEKLYLQTIDFQEHLINKIASKYA